MSSDIIKLSRIRDIPDSAVKDIDIYTFSVDAQSDKHKELKYMVFYSFGQSRWLCNCKDFLFRGDTDNYECKHIGKVRDMLLKRMQK
jgi:hypothetical protein